MYTWHKQYSRRIMYTQTVLQENHVHTEDMNSIPGESCIHRKHEQYWLVLVESILFTHLKYKTNFNLWRSWLYLAPERNCTLASNQDFNILNQKRKSMKSRCTIAIPASPTEPRSYLMLRTTLLQWFVFISSNACSSCWTKWSRVAGSVCKKWVLWSPFLLRFSFTVTAGLICCRRLLLASLETQKEHNNYFIFMLHW